MQGKTNRREFLTRSAFAAVGLSLTSCVTDKAADAQQPWFKISLAQWSLHRALFGGKLNNLDFARVSKEEYGIDAVEYVNQFFKDKGKDLKYLGEMKRRSDDLGVKNVLIMVDDEGEIGHALEKERLKAVQNHYQWIEAAKFLGCHAIRLNAYSTGTFDEQLARCADGLSHVVEFAAHQHMNVLVENHGHMSSNGKWVAALMKKVNHVHCGTLPDFGNFEKEQDRYQSVADMMPWAKGVSGKSHEFDAQGNEVQTDFRRMLTIVKNAGYRGYIEAEYEGEKLSEPDGIRATKRLLEKVRDELA